jgi:superfamily II DNA or RNA helicase
MPIDIDASSDTTPLAHLQQVFDAPLHRAAQQLIDLGGVSDVRVLQGGRVVTGIAGDRQRVYVQYQGADALTFEGECSCGERSPCVHVAAVVMTAGKILGAPADNRLRGTAPLPQPPTHGAERSAPLRQALCYLMEPTAGGGLRLSTWVTQTLMASGHVQTGACPFAPRTSGGSRDYPRYVDVCDRDILEALTSRQFDGPWELTSATGFDLLQRALATGRAFWRSLPGVASADGTASLQELPPRQGATSLWHKALRASAAREVRFAWQILPNGDQRLSCDSPEALDFLLDFEPAVYIAASGSCGPLELPYPLDLLRQYWTRPAVDPAQVPTINADLASDSRASRFPRLRSLTLQRQALSSLRAQLVLSTAPQAILHFVYNDVIVDSGTLLPKDSVRQWDGEVVREITRDLDVERQLRAQLQRFLNAPRDGAAWLAFMMNGVPALQTLGWQITVDPDFPYRIAAAEDWYADLQTTPHHPRGTNSSREWFDLRLGVRVDGHAVNLLPALVSYLQGAGRESAGQHDGLSLAVAEHLLVRLEDGRYLPVPLARIQRIADTLVELCDQDGLNEHHALTLPATQAGRLAQFALEPNAPALQSDDPTLLSLIDAVKDFSHIEPLAAPAHFPATLRPYQEYGLGWLQFLRRHGLGGILADDMGLGKTVQTLAHLVIEKQQGRLRKPSLIVAPVSVLGNWQQEIRRFAPELTLLVLHGAKRKERFASIGAADLILIGYPLLLVDGDTLLERDFSFVILDEAQTVKNPQAKVSQVAQALRAEHRLCLSGTPMENHLGDLWSLFNFVQPGLLGERRQFQRLYRTPIENGGDVKRAAALSRRVQPFLLRRTKDAVARDLPPKVQIVEAIELDERQRDFYDGIRLSVHRRVREAIERQGLARSHLTVLNALLKLRQACCDPRLVDADAPTQLIPSAKLDWLSTALPELIAEGRRILLFSQFTSMLSLIETRVRELSIPYCLLTGETRHRSELVERFQTGGVPLFLISLKAGGTGLNLTAADTIIHYDPWWNPAVEAQATDRAHRIGQDKPVFVYKLIAQGTVEEKIMQLQADKHALVTQLYTEKIASASQLCSADLEALFAP